MWRNITVDFQCDSSEVTTRNPEYRYVYSFCPCTVSQTEVKTNFGRWKHLLTSPNIK